MYSTWHQGMAFSFTPKLYWVRNGGMDMCQTNRQGLTANLLGARRLFKRGSSQAQTLLKHASLAPSSRPEGLTIV